MKKRNSFHAFIFLCILLSSHCSFICISHANPTNIKVYIVYLGEKPHDDHKLIKESHSDLLAKVLGSKDEAKKSIIYNYKYSFTGFAAKLTQSQAKQLAGIRGVVKVVEDKHHQVQTSRSWDFLGLSDNANANNNNNYDNLQHKTNYGDGIIIGVIDSGIMGLGPSFNDEGLGPVPQRWKGVCKSMSGFNATEQCNRKVIGARWFYKGALHRYELDAKTLRKTDDFSALDTYGHGTQVASIAAGAFVDNVSYTGLDFGTARGGAPRARIASYKACWVLKDYSLGCSSADILGAFDYAVRDGVDVISISIGMPIPLQSDVEDQNGVGIGSFHAVSRGIPVVIGAGNDGPSAFTVTNVEPWLFTVGASSMDRAFLYPITLGNNETILVDSHIPEGTPGFSPLYFLGRYLGEADLAEIALDKNDVANKIVFIFGLTRDQRMTFVGKAYEAGAIGVIYSNPLSVDSLPRSGLEIPCIQVDFDAGTRIKEYIFQEKNPTARMGFSGITVGKAFVPKIKAFSSRGPSSLAPSILKPDITAPGDKILCATIPGDPGQDNGFVVESGTSHATPHVAAIVALLKASHPDWSPAALRSALVTTAWNSDTYSYPIFAEGSAERVADAFDYGGGIVNANGADDPGLVYNMSRADYISYDCSLGYNNSAIYQTTKETPKYDVKQEQTICPKIKPSVLDLNLPSIIVPNLKKPVTINRTVTNVGNVNSVYKAVINSPLGTIVSVRPNVLKFDANTKKISFTVKISAAGEVNAGFTFGSLTWTDGVHKVRSPIAVRKQFIPLYF